MKTLYWISNGIIYVVGAFLIVYYGAVHLNLVVTNPHLPPDDVSYYQTNKHYPGQIEYLTGVDYWVFASRFLRLIPLWTLSTAIGGAMLYRNTFESLAITFNAILLVWEFLTFVYRIVEWGTCGSYGQVCRPFNPATSTSAFGNTNFIFEWELWFGLAWMGVLAIIIYLLTEIKSARKDFWENLTKKYPGFVDMPESARTALVEQFYSFAEKSYGVVSEKLASASLIGKGK